MQENFSWYFPLNKNEIEALWEEAILTVDANVLLDLYRYHESTRNALLDALKRFEGRLWLSHQTAEEFFRNRKRVIVGAASAFDEAKQNIDDFAKAADDIVSKVRKNRIIPDSISESLRAAVDNALEKARQAVSESHAQHPDFLAHDPILDRLAALFQGAVGEAFSSSRSADAMAEAERRIREKIPPGYLDSKKSGTKAYGDYFMWCQILDHAAEEKKPIIFVTSEAKEDWWERAAGKTIGLHYELLRESYALTGQRLLAYQTDRFFRYSAELRGEVSNESAAKEISEFVQARSVPLIRVISQLESVASSERNAGQLTIELLRPAYRFTCSGHIAPNLTDIPNLKVRLASHPDGMPNHIVRSGAGTTFDFHIHVKSIDYEEYLPVGEYVFDYDASATVR